MSDDNDLADDLRIYGSCYWKMIDGKRVRVPIEKVRYIKVRYIDSHAIEVGGEIVSSAYRSGSTSTGELK
jgi:hypothetical protein